MSVEAINRVLDHSPTTSSKRLLLVVIANFVNDELGYAWPRIDTLASRAMLSERQVQRYIRELEQEGELAVRYSTGRGKTNEYRVIVGLEDAPVWSRPRQEQKGDIQNKRVTSEVEAPVQKGDTGNQRVTPTVAERVTARTENPTSDVTPTKEQPNQREQKTELMAFGQAEGRKDTPPEPTRRSRKTGNADFDRWYSLYPRKVKRARAEKAWSKIDPDPELVDDMITALERQKGSRDWTKDDGQFIPHPSTWLNDRQWEDEIASSPEQRKRDDIAAFLAEAGDDVEELDVPAVDEDDEDDTVVEAEWHEPENKSDEDADAKLSRELRNLGFTDEEIEAIINDPTDDVAAYVEGSTDGWDDDGWTVIGGGGRT